MKISVDITGIEAAKARVAGMGRQVAFAASQALNATAKAIADAAPAELEKNLDRPTPFTKRGVRVLRYASKDRIEATVGFMTAQAKYMKWATAGGTRNPGAAGLKLPAAIQVNEFGNIPKGVIAKLVAVARKEGKLGKVTARRVAISNKVELFYGDPKDQKGKVWPRGIYKIANGALIPLILFPVKAARYRVRFDFEKLATGIVRKEWSRQMDAALANALRTAR